MTMDYDTDIYTNGMTKTWFLEGSDGEYWWMVMVIGETNV